MRTYLGRHPRPRSGIQKDRRAKAPWIPAFAGMTRCTINAQKWYYPVPIEAQMRAFYQALSEKDRRRYAAIEARKLGYGGVSYIIRALLKRRNYRLRKAQRRRR